MHVLYIYFGQNSITKAVVDNRYVYNNNNKHDTHIWI